MESTNVIWITGILATFAGMCLGIALTLWLAPSKQKSLDLEKHLNTKQDEIKNYQHEVMAHFTKTAELLGGLTRSYRDVHNHLAQGAQNLCGENMNTTPILSKLSIAEDEGEKSAHSVSPPLDYAPRSSPYEQGTLNEEYGLEKVSLDGNAATATTIEEDIAVIPPSNIQPIPPPKEPDH